MKKKATAVIVNNEEISPGIYSMRIKNDMAGEVIPGQFIGVYTKDSSKLLPRPISICESDKKAGEIRIVYRVAGEGTDAISHMKKEESISILGILGNGYDTGLSRGKVNVTLMAGGIGIPPMLELAKVLSGNSKPDQKITAVIGYRNKDIFLNEELEKYADVYIATDDGSVGFRGNVIDALEHYKLNPDIIYACGPMPMLRGIKTYCKEKDIPGYISLEERMACGVGACLGCVCRTVEKDGHSNVRNARICTDGPVFSVTEVNI